MKTTNSILGRDEILATRGTLKSERVSVPEWGGDVIVRELTGAERDAWEASIVDVNTGSFTEEKAANTRAKLVARTVVDEAGNRLFTEEDIERLGGLSASGLSRVFNVAASLSGLTEKDIEDLEGNSSAGPSAGSGSSSPANSDRQ
ncbi:MAG: hypothetical protein GY906_11635 [bacterium]|nr:hypothetical protein [bacterium]